MASDLFGYLQRRFNRLVAAVAFTPFVAVDLAMFVVCAACFYNGEWYWF